MITEDQLPMPKQQLIKATGISEYMLDKLIRKRLHAARKQRVRNEADL